MGHLALITYSHGEIHLCFSGGIPIIGMNDQLLRQSCGTELCIQNLV